ncbi:multidrug and toxin extrusion protein 1-like [Mytilus trossulus]|uniref:multidrug and toxin extrusion protein 1-like n=1 Tax=Mytilus trossulus TaxID=6551 RepID=UPI003007BED9
MILNTLEDSCATVRKKIFPHGYRTELIELLRIAWPITIEGFLQYAILSVSFLFCGHLGKESLDGVQLASSTINVVGFSVMIGLTTAFDTLLSQTFGSHNKQDLCLILQKGILIMLLACIPIFAIFVNTEYLLILVGQNREVAKLSGQYVTIAIAGFPGCVITLALMKYLQCQNIVIPGVLLQLVANILNVVYHLILVTGFGFGVRGAAVAVVCTFWTQLFLYLIFIRCSKIYKEEWTGCRKEAFLEWGTFLNLAIPGIFMISVDWWSFEISVIIVGYLGKVQLAAHSIVYQIHSELYMISLGISSAVCIKVGQNVGAGDPIKAQTSARVGILVGCLSSLFTSTFYLSMKDIAPKAYTSDSEILHWTSKVMPLIATFNLFDNLMLVLNGILRGTGHQKYGGIVTVIAHYIIGIPLLVVFVLYTNLKIAGVWWAFCIVIVIMFILYAAKTYSLNWEYECKKAQEMTAVNIKDPTDYGGNHNTSCSYTEAEPSDNDYRQLFEQNKGESSISLYKLIICQRCLIFVSLLLILVASIVMNMFCNHIYRNNSQCNGNNTMYNMTQYANVSSNDIVCQP